MLNVAEAQSFTGERIAQYRNPEGEWYLFWTKPAVSIKSDPSWISYVVLPQPRR